MLFNKKKKNGYQTRKQLQRSEKIKIIVVSVFFVLMCAATGVTCALVAISAKESSETEGFSSDTSFLTIDDVEPIE
jgi:flagellar basal body-associated protein FliL